MEKSNFENLNSCARGDWDACKSFCKGVVDDAVKGVKKVVDDAVKGVKNNDAYGCHVDGKEECCERVDASLKHLKNHGRGVLDIFQLCQEASKIYCRNCS